MRLGTTATEGAVPSAIMRLIGDEGLRAVDVGARHEPLPVLASAAGVVDLWAVEPDVQEAERLRTDVCPRQGWRHAEVLPLALWNHSGHADLYVTREPALSSLRRPDPAKRHFDDWDVLEVRKIPVETLDDLVADGIVGARPDFLKVDAQGGEWEVLSGAQGVLANVDMVEVEVRFVQQYLDQHTFLDTASLLRQHGFAMIGLEVVYYGGVGVDARRCEGPAGRRRLSHGDVLFIRADIDDLPPRRRRNLTALLLAYGYPHEALLMAESLDDSSRRTVTAAVAASEHSIRDRLALIGDALAYAFGPSRARRFAVAQRAVSLGDGRRYSVPRIS